MIDPSELPQSLRDSPPVITARLDSHRRRLDDHENRLHQLEHHMIQTPVGALPLHVVLIVLLALVAWRPDLAAKLIGH